VCRKVVCAHWDQHADAGRWCFDKCVAHRKQCLLSSFSVGEATKKSVRTQTKVAVFLALSLTYILCSCQEVSRIIGV
jgi:hypothetical protein